MQKQRKFLRAVLFSGLNFLLTVSIFEVHAGVVRECRYIPGVSVPAEMPADLLTPPVTPAAITPTPPDAMPVDASATTRQKGVFDGLWNAVNDHYVYPDFLGHDWNAIGAKYESLIEQGLSDDAFY